MSLLLAQQQRVMQFLHFQANGADTTGCSLVDSMMMACSGTSMATPQVAGAFALMRQYFKLAENKIVMPNETQRYLNDTGKQITDSEVLINATLEINNTNFTMAGSGLSWNVNVSILVNGTYAYKDYGNDSFGNMNFSDTFIINIDLIPPYWGNNITNISGLNNIRKNDVLQFNATWNDTVALSYFIFSWNDTGTWDNSTKGSLNGKTQTVSANKTITAKRGNAIGYKFYANDSVNNFNQTETWTFSIANTNPSATNITINSTDSLNRTNGTLTGIFSFSDLDNDLISANETRWYNNSEEVLELASYTAITSNYTKKSQSWTFSVRVFDGFNWSEWQNSTNLTIRNAAPSINITIESITINETQKTNITINASDIDNDALAFTINDTRFSLDSIYFYM